MWNSLKMQKIGTSISVVNSHLITYPSIAVCKDMSTTKMTAFVQGREPPVFPPTPNVSEFVHIIRQHNSDGFPPDTISTNSDLDNRDIISHILFVNRHNDLASYKGLVNYNQRLILNS